ncbi:hypothetical protein ACFW2V_13100 [Streptomyces sp. NPDC058947]|uniref:hypothetical protein n=1 Tax=Streptomyces sp. NPDC058947 TaxID=3346675 RepID=UPI0036A5C651
MTTVLTGIVARGHASWIVDLQGLPEGKTGVAMGTTWAKAKAAAEELAEHILSEPKGSVVVDLVLADDDLQRLIDEVKRTKAAVQKAQEEADAAFGKAARTLTATSTVRDVAAMLGYSHQYVAKVASKGRT